MSNHPFIALEGKIAMRSFAVILFAGLSACIVRAAEHCEGASVTRNDNNKFATWKGVESSWTCAEGLCCPGNVCEAVSQTKPCPLVNASRL